MKVSVCNTITYHYEVEVPEWMCEKDEEGYLEHEDLLVNACYDADKNTLTHSDEWTNYIISIRNTDTDEELYIG